VLVEPGGLQGDAGDRFGERVEEQEVSLEPANFVGDEVPPAAFAVDEGAAAAVAFGGEFGAAAAADVLADDAAVDPPGAGVVAAAVGGGVPGHGGRLRSGAVAGALHKSRHRRAAGAVGVVLPTLGRLRGPS
jgi:hypothetical protein